MLEREKIQQIRIVDIRMSFISMVVFMVKWALAAIPAFIILAIIWSVVVSLLSGFAPTWYI
ncbi:MAG TPA: hypothetical protein VKA68_13195 [bacterium]|nr:hypothetical protein [bacterium]